MEDINIKVQGSLSKMLVISYKDQIKISLKELLSYKDQIKISLKELYREGYIDNDNQVNELSDSTLKIIINKYRDKKIKLGTKKMKGGKHVIHQI